MEVKPLRQDSVPAGYKQTEVGVIPEEWDVEKIGDLIEKQFILGHLDGNHGELYPRSHEFKSYGVPYVGANDFEEGNVTFERCKFLSDERAAKFRKGVARDGDVLFAHNATVGPVALLRTTYPVVILSTTATYFRCNPEKLSNAYLKGALQAQHFVRQYQAVMAQSTRFQVPIMAQRKLSLVIAPLPEQRAIATALSNVDGVLGGLDRLIAKKRDLKQAAMQQLLTGQTRLPGFHGEWEVKRLSQHFKIYAGGDVPKHSFSQTQSDAHPYPIFANAIQNKGLYGYTNEHRSKANSLTITARGYLGHAEYRDQPFFPIVRLLVLEPSGQLDARFTTYAVNDRVEFAIESTGVPQLTAPQVGKYSVAAPPTIAEQTAIAEVLTDMDAELAGLEQRREKTRALKQVMMQELLTGRTRLVNSQKATA